MRLVEDIRGFFTRERKWRWIAAALALIVCGQVIEGLGINWLGLPQRGKELSFGLYERLRVIQLDTVAQRYAAAGAERHGIAQCGPTQRRVAPPAEFRRTLPGLDALTPLERAPVLNPSLFPPGSATRRMVEDKLAVEASGGTPNLFEAHRNALPPTAPTPRLNQPLDPATADAIRRQTPVTVLNELLAEKGNAPPPPEWNCSDGILRLVDRVALTLRTTPEVAGELWQTGWLNRILLIATVLAMLGAVVLLWRDPDVAGAGALMGTGGVLLFGPVAVGVMFWLLLQMLLGLILAVGWALAGISAIAGGALAAWKIGSLFVGALKQADELEENARRVRTLVDDLRPRG